MTVREQLLKELTEAPDTLVEELLKLCLDRKRSHSSRSNIDAALIEMLADPDYQADVTQMETEFAAAQWESRNGGSGAGSGEVSVSPISWLSQE
jgi:hypothetical protein